MAEAPTADAVTDRRPGALRVEIFADVLCPWCFVGERRLAAALASLSGRDRVQVVRRSYELAPGLSRVPGPTAAEEMAASGWWGAEAAARIARIRTVGAAEGLGLNLHRARPVNTFDAHRLTHLAAAYGRGERVWQDLLHTYHTDALDVADPAVLERVGVAAGLDAAAVRAVTAGTAYAGAVRADERRAVERGVTSIPAVVVDGRAPVPGVQASAALRELLAAALDRTGGGRPPRGPAG